jgi:DNA-binding NarL/FixJ family response regulator
MPSDSVLSNSPVRVMIVEDHLVYRMGLKVLLEAHPDLEVIAEAADGERAILLAQQMQPDVIVMDVSMPVLDGIESTKEIKVLVPKSKVLMLTSYDGDNYLFSALSAGADGYCLKDAPIQSICVAIRAVNSGACWLDPVVAKKVIRAYTTTKVAPPSGLILQDSARSVLSARQVEILELVVDGMSNVQMAVHLSVSLDTVKTHMRNILGRLAVSDRTQAAVKAIRSGLVKLEV